MDQSKATKFALAALLFAAVGVIGVAWYLLSSLTAWVGSQDSDLLAAIIAASASILVGFGAIVLSQQRTKTREIAESHRPQKIEIYTKFVKKIMQAMQESKKGLPDEGLSKSIELPAFFQEFTNELILWGSPNVIDAYEKFRFLSASPNGGSDIVFAMDDVLSAMRKDIGHSDWLLKRGDLVKLYLKNPRELDAIRN